MNRASLNRVRGNMRPWIVLLACVGCGGAPFTTAAYFVDGGPETGPETGVPASPRDSGGAESDAGGGDDEKSNAEAATDASAIDATPTEAAPPEACSPLDHSNGWGGTYEDCAPLGQPGDSASYSETMAREAASAWGGTISTTDCGSPANGEPGITATGGGTCITWIYAGGLAGSSIKVAGGQCDCPGITENPWN